MPSGEFIMKGTIKGISLFLFLFVSIAVVFSVALHSIDEIHYLKSFYPGRFTVEEAFYASGVELIKVIIVSIPFSMLILTSLYLLKMYIKK